MMIQKTLTEQIKDSSTPLNSPEPSGRGRDLQVRGRGSVACRRGAVFPVGLARRKAERSPGRVAGLRPPGSCSPFSLGSQLRVGLHGMSLNP